jgi:S-methylmethionine-dependent homocysteine/selenocysteine methylase
LDSVLKHVWVNKTPGLKAIGINCTPERLIGPLLRSLDGVDHVPVILYPNREESFEDEGPPVAAYPSRQDEKCNIIIFPS